MPRLAEASLDLRVVAAAAVLTLGCTFRFGLAPFAPQRSRWFRPGLVVVQITLTLVLLSSAATFVEALIHQLQTPLGMRAEQTLVAENNLHREGYPDRPQQLQFFESVEARLRQIPGVQAVAVTDAVPPEGSAQTTIFSTIQVEGRPANRGSPTGGMVVHRQVTPDYFAILDIPILQGRAFTEADRNGPEDAVLEQFLT